MLPSQPVNYFTNSLSLSVKECGNFADRPLLNVVKPSHLNNHLVGHLRSKVLLSFDSVWRKGQRVSLALGLSVLFHFVVRVALAGIREKMCRISTRSKIAMMTHLHSFWDASVGVEVGKSVRVPELVINGGNAVTHSIFVRFDGSSPNPARSNVAQCVVDKVWAFLVELWPEVFRSRSLFQVHKQKTPADFEVKSASEGGNKDSGRKLWFSLINIGSPLQRLAAA